MTSSCNCPVTSLCSYAELQENSISHLSWSFIREFVDSLYRWSYAPLCMSTQDKTTKLWKLHILRDRIGVGLVKSLNQGLWLHIRIHFTPLISKRIKDILTQKHQCNANEKNAFRKKKSIYFFQISAVCKGVSAYMHTTFLVAEIAAKFYTGNKEPPKNRERVFFCLV